MRIKKGQRLRVELEGEVDQTGPGYFRLFSGDLASTIYENAEYVVSVEVLHDPDAEPAPALTVTGTEVNVLAQRFYEASGISLPAMTDKPKIVAGLRAVFADMGVQVTDPERKWWPCDVVLDGAGRVFLRLGEDRWRYLPQRTGARMLAPEVPHDFPARPLTLLVRSGKPVQS